MEQITDTVKRPIIMVILALVLGFAFGLTWGWAIDPVDYINASAFDLRADLRQEYLRSTIDSLRVNGDFDLAFKRYAELETRGPETLAQIEANPGKTDPAMIAIFKQELEKRGGTVGQQPSPVGETPGAVQAEDGGGSILTTILIALVVILVIGAIGFAVMYLFGSYRGKGALSAAAQAAEISRSVEKTDYSAVASTPPVAQYVTTYMLGDDLFDDSFSIDSQSGEFLGECGVGISETIGVGDPKKVAAFEVWMFDKNDIQTVTKVLMSPYTFNDANFRAKLESKGELVAAQPRKQAVLETQTLQMVVTVVDVQYGSGALPQDSYFDRVTLELAIWNK